MSPDLFNLVLETVMRLALENEEVGVELCGRLVNNLRFADDINLMSETIVGLQKITDQISQQGERLGLVINSGKTKVMMISKEQQDLQITVNFSKGRSYRGVCISFSEFFFAFTYLIFLSLRYDCL